MITARELDHAHTRTTDPDLADALARLAWRAYTAEADDPPDLGHRDVTAMITTDRHGDGDVIADARDVATTYTAADPADREATATVVAPVALALATTARHLAADIMPTRSTPDHLAPRLAAEAMREAADAHRFANLAARTMPGTDLARDAEAIADVAADLAQRAARHAEGYTA